MSMKNYSILILDASAPSSEGHPQQYTVNTIRSIAKIITDIGDTTDAEITDTLLYDSEGSAIGAITCSDLSLDDWSAKINQISADIICLSFAVVPDALSACQQFTEMARILEQSSVRILAGERYFDICYSPQII